MQRLILRSQCNKTVAIAGQGKVVNSREERALRRSQYDAKKVDKVSALKKKDN